MAREYTVGIPVATVLFVGLIVAAYMTMFRALPGEEELRAESVAVIQELRVRGAAFLPPNNNDPTGVTMHAVPESNATIVRVYGLISPARQDELVRIAQRVRDERAKRPIVIQFHYAERTDPDPETGYEPISAIEAPEPFRTERITLSSEDAVNAPDD